MAIASFDPGFDTPFEIKRPLVTYYTGHFKNCSLVL